MRRRGPTARIGPRLGARAIDSVLEIAAGAVVLYVLSDLGRPYATLFVIAALVTAYETVSVATAGATVGKLVVGIRVVELDATDGVSWSAAVRRSSVLGPLLVLAVPVPGLLISVATSPLHRGVHDRLARTYVVDPRLAAGITSDDLLAIAGLEVLPAPTRWGICPPAAVRRRARLHRLDDAPLLVLGLLVLALLAAFGSGIGGVLLLTTGPWLVLFLVDETRRIARCGQTAGHRRAGLVVVDTTTGEAPSTSRSFVRALVIGLGLYVPLLGWLVVLLPDAIALVSTADHRSIHDRLARTVVIVDPRLAPEERYRTSVALAAGAGSAGAVT